MTNLIMVLIEWIVGSFLAYFMAKKAHQQSYKVYMIELVFMFLPILNILPILINLPYVKFKYNSDLRNKFFRTGGGK